MLELTREYNEPIDLESKISWIFNTLDIKESIEDYRRIRINGDYPHETTLHHPIKEVHYGYAQRHFPELLNKQI